MKGINLINKEIRHNRFGVGVIIDLNGDVITIDFIDAGVKKISFNQAVNNKLLIFMDEEIVFETPKTVFKKTKEDLFFEKLNNIKNNKEKLLYELIIEYIDDEKIFSMLIERVTKIVLNSQRKEISDFEKQVVLFFMSMIAFKYYDGSLWPYVRKTLNKLYQLLSVEKIEHSIRSFIVNNDLFIGNRHITNTLVHAAIPFNFFKSYFVFVYDIFTLNFEKSIEGVPVDDVLYETFCGLKSTLLDDKGEEDKLNLAVTNKTYELIKSTKLAIIHYPLEMAKITNTFIQMIHNWYYNNPIDNKISSYHKKAFNSWVEKQKREKPSVSKKEYIRNPRFNFNRNHNTIYLEFPSISIKEMNDIDVNKIDIVLKTNLEEKTLIHQRDFIVMNRIGYKSIIINPQKIINPLGDIKIIAKYNNEIVYPSFNKLKRDYIIFNENGKEIYKNNKYDGLVYLVHNQNFKTEGSEEINFEHYKITIFQANSVKMYHLGEESIYFSRMVKEDLYGELVNEVICLADNKEVKVYKKADYYIFTSIFQAEDIFIYINEIKYKLVDLLDSFDEFENRYRYNVNLAKLNLNFGIYNIVIINKLNERLKIETFIIDNDFEIIMNDIGNLKYDININSSFNLEQYKKENFDFGIFEQAEFNFTLGGISFKYLVLSFPRFKYNINDKWQKLSNLEFVSNKLYTTKEIENIVVCLSDETKFKLELIESKNNYNVYDLTRFTSYKVDFDYIDFEIHFKEKEPIYLTFYLNQAVVGLPKIEFLSNEQLKIDFDIKCFQKENLVLEIIDSTNNKKEVVLNEKHVILNDYKPYEDYHFIIRKKVRNIFFEKEKTLYNLTYKIFDTKKLKGKLFKITKVGYWNKAGQEKEIEIQPTGIKFIKKVNQEDFNFNASNFNLLNDYYLCKLYKISHYGSIIPFKRKEKLYCEIASDRDSPYLTVYIVDECGDGLTLDLKREILEEEDKGINDAIDYLYINTNNGEIK